MITPKDAATLVDWPNPDRRKEIHEFVLHANARELQLFVHLIATDTTDAREWRSRAGTAISICIADDQTKAAEKMEKHTVALVELTQALLGETKILRWLTVGLFILTICLLVLAICPIVRP